MKKKKNLFKLQKNTISKLTGGRLNNQQDNVLVKDSQFVTLCNTTHPTANTFCFVCPPHFPDF